MTPETIEWLDGLRAAVAAARSTPSAGPPAGPAAAAERMILAADLALWLDESPSQREARRRFAASRAGIDADPAIVVTTSEAGISAMAEILGRGDAVARDLAPRLACVTEKEYRAWCMRHPDDGYRLHVNHWSWIKTRVPPRRHVEFARHPLRDGDAYWLHRTGTTGAGEADARTAHLWKFDGRRAVLLEPRVVEGRAARPGR